MSKWIGYAVSVNCGEPLGCYQGTILEADGSTITLTKAFRNGFPYPKSQVTLKAADIKELKIIEKAAEQGEVSQSTVAVSKNKKAPRAPVAATLRPAPAAVTLQPAPPAATLRPAPPAAVSAAPTPDRDEKTSHSNKTSRAGRGGGGASPGGAGGAGGTGGTGRLRRRRDEACFGAAASPAAGDDFDFEGNLALFDRAALRESMRAARPDLLRHADPKLRPDQPALSPPPAPPPPPAAALPPELRGGPDYVTDGGARVACAGAPLRRRLWDGLRRLGVAEAADALLARAVADVALRLCGGGRRLEARNAHQAPRVCVVAGAHRAGAAALLAGRLLAAHGARVRVLRPARGCAEAERALAAGEGALEVAEEAGALGAADVVVLAAHDPAAGACAGASAALGWARGARAHLVCVEPPPGGWEGVAGRAAVLAVCAGAVPAALGRVLLANVCPPRRLFAELGLTYAPPFGATSPLPLHPADE